MRLNLTRYAIKAYPVFATNLDEIIVINRNDIVCN